VPERSPIPGTEESSPIGRQGEKLDDFSYFLSLEK
jgi:hypothetical protein